MFHSVGMHLTEVINTSIRRSIKNNVMINKYNVQIIIMDKNKNYKIVGGVYE